jgi:hypothetical protein
MIDQTYGLYAGAMEPMHVSLGPCATVSACTRSNVCERRVQSLLRAPSKSPPSAEEIVVRSQPTISRAEQVGTRPSFRLGTTRMVVGRSRSWTPRRNYEDMAIHRVSIGPCAERRRHSRCMRIGRAPAHEC